MEAENKNRVLITALTSEWNSAVLGFQPGAGTEGARVEDCGLQFGEIYLFGMEEGQP